jgi:hypothetical protein
MKGVLETGRPRSRKLRVKYLMTHHSMKRHRG